MKNMVDLTGKTILVTGASDGIGAEVCRTINKFGARVILVARNEEKLAGVAAQLKGEGNRYYSFDLTKIEEIEAFVKSVVQENGKLDGIVHSAGVGMGRPFKQVKYNVIHNLMLINFYAFYELTRVFSNKRYNNGGSVVVLSSVSARQGEKAQTAYGATKAAVEGAVRAISKELSDKNIRVNAVTAGMTRTRMYESFSSHYDQGSQDSLFSKQYLGLIEKKDIANAVAYLLSDASRFITGTGLVVDGGYLS